MRIRTCRKWRDELELQADLVIGDFLRECEAVRNFHQEYFKRLLVKRLEDIVLMFKGKLINLD